MGGDFLEIVLDELPLRQAMLRFSTNILLLSLVISGITATLVYFALHRMLVRPMRRITANSARITPTTTTMITSGSRASCCCPFRTSSMTRRVRYGRVIVQAIRPMAASAVTATDHLYGLRNVSSLTSGRRGNSGG